MLRRSRRATSTTRVVHADGDCGVRHGPDRRGEQLAHRHGRAGRCGVHDAAERSTGGTVARGCVGGSVLRDATDGCHSGRRRKHGHGQHDQRDACDRDRPRRGPDLHHEPAVACSSRWTHVADVRGLQHQQRRHVHPHRNRPRPDQRHSPAAWSSRSRSRGTVRPPATASVGHPASGCPTDAPPVIQRGHALRTRHRTATDAVVGGGVPGPLRRRARLRRHLGLRPLPTDVRRRTGRVLRGQHDPRGVERHHRARAARAARHRHDLPAPRRLRGRGHHDRPRVERPARARVRRRVVRRRAPRAGHPVPAREGARRRVRGGGADRAGSAHHRRLHLRRAATSRCATRRCSLVRCSNRTRRSGSVRRARSA